MNYVLFSLTLFCLGLPGLATSPGPSEHLAASSSANLHRFFRSLRARPHRHLMLGPPPGKFFFNSKIGTAIGGTLSLKMPDVPSPIFVNQNPFYSFI